MVEIGQNTAESTGDLGRLTVYQSPVENPQLKLVQKKTQMDNENKHAKYHTRKLRKGNPKRETESLLIAENNAIRTNYGKKWHNSRK